MRIFFSVGEPSGDQHAAHLIQELKTRNPKIQTEGFGGPEMRKQGCSLQFELTQLAVMGFLRVIPMLAKFRRLVIQAETFFDETPPDAVVLVDFPGFNWWIAKAAKRRGIPVFYYMPPQLWAWAPWRIRRVRKWVDHVICALPFEFEWYKSRDVNATWVGHPFFDEVASRKLDMDLVAKLGASESRRPVIAVLPGSRNHEVDRNFPVMLDVIHRVHKRVPNVRWVIGNYSPDHSSECQRMQSDTGVAADMTYYVDRTSEVIEAADCCFMVSGSISLELLARRTPGVVLYRVGRLGRMAARVLMTCRFITLTNLIADKELMPEFVSCGNPASDAAAISDQLTRWCLDPNSLACRRDEMSELADQAAVTGATERTAELLLSALNDESTGVGHARQVA
ncbi:MAG TPA: lipid-A-disaccharide synthase [Planctomycetes bacterium]|nr:lipid-A-disaccharide synthase [Fuerstiella sp.]HIK91207.1 lipid-A-disaccharide synthase [Planctomycetota bacterium]